MKASSVYQPKLRESSLRNQGPRDSSPPAPNGAGGLYIPKTPASLDVPFRFTNAHPASWPSQLLHSIEIMQSHSPPSHFTHTATPLKRTKRLRKKARDKFSPIIALILLIILNAGCHGLSFTSPMFDLTVNSGNHEGTARPSQKVDGNGTQP